MDLTLPLLRYRDKNPKQNRQQRGSSANRPAWKNTYGSNITMITRAGSAVRSFEEHKINTRSNYAHKGLYTKVFARCRAWGV